MTERTGELWLVRHGETEWSRTGKHTSTTEVPLTEAGEKAAVALAESLRGVPFDLVLTSPRERARRTAQLAGFGEAIVRDDLTEWDYGEYEGLTTAEIRTRVPRWTVWSHRCPGGESEDAVSRRLDQVVAEVRATAGRVLIFGHGHASRALAMRWLGLSVNGGRLLTLDPATISVLGYDHENPAIARWNAAP